MGWVKRGIVAIGTCRSQVETTVTTTPMVNTGSNSASFSTGVPSEQGACSIIGNLEVIYDWSDMNNPPFTGFWYLQFQAAGEVNMHNAGYNATFPWPPGSASGGTGHGLNPPPVTKDFVNAPGWNMSAKPAMDGSLTFNMPVYVKSDSYGLLNSSGSMSYAFQEIGSPFTP